MASSMNSSVKRVTLTDDQLSKFRTQICEKHRNDKCLHPDRCSDSHCQTWQRRNPCHYTYGFLMCPNIEFIKKGKKMTLVGRCSRGRVCVYAHSKEEELYHPRMYKTKMCNAHPYCARYFCPFAHDPTELRTPSDSCLNIVGKPNRSASHLLRNFFSSIKSQPDHFFNDTYTKRAMLPSGSCLLESPTSLSTTASSSLASPTASSSSSSFSSCSSEKYDNATLRDCESKSNNNDSTHENNAAIATVATTDTLAVSTAPQEIQRRKAVQLKFERPPFSVEANLDLSLDSMNYCLLAEETRLSANPTYLDSALNTTSYTTPFHDSSSLGSDSSCCLTKQSHHALLATDDSYETIGSRPQCLLPRECSDVLPHHVRKSPCYSPHLQNFFYTSPSSPPNKGAFPQPTRGDGKLHMTFDEILKTKDVSSASDVAPLSFASIHAASRLESEKFLFTQAYAYNNTSYAKSHTPNSTCVYGGYEGVTEETRGEHRSCTSSSHSPTLGGSFTPLSNAFKQQTYGEVPPKSMTPSQSSARDYSLFPLRFNQEADDIDLHHAPWQNHWPSDASTLDSLYNLNDHYPQREQPYGDDRWGEKNESPFNARTSHVEETTKQYPVSSINALASLLIHSLDEYRLSPSYSCGTNVSATPVIGPDGEFQSFDPMLYSDTSPLNRFPLSHMNDPFFHTARHTPIQENHRLMPCCRQPSKPRDILPRSINRYARQSNQNTQSPSATFF